LVVTAVEHRVERRCDERHTCRDARSCIVVVVLVGSVIVLRQRRSAQRKYDRDRQPHVHVTSYIPFWRMYSSHAASTSVEVAVDVRLAPRYVTHSGAVLPHTSSFSRWSRQHTTTASWNGRCSSIVWSL